MSSLATCTPPGARTRIGFCAHAETLSKGVQSPLLAGHISVGSTVGGRYRERGQLAADRHQQYPKKNRSHANMVPDFRQPAMLDGCAGRSKGVLSHQTIGRSNP
jgi:hypothetical protein